MCLVVQDKTWRSQTMSSFAILWRFGPGAHCHGNLAVLTVHWIQSWHLQVELVGPRELNSSQLNSLGGASLISCWSQNHHHLLIPVTILELASPEKKNSPQGRHITHAHRGTIHQHWRLHSKSVSRGEKEWMCVHTQVTAKQVPSVVTLPWAHL